MELLLPLLLLLLLEKERKTAVSTLFKVTYSKYLSSDTRGAVSVNKKQKQR